MACRHQKGRYSPQTAVSTCFRRVTENLAKGPRSDGIGPVVGWCWCFRSRGDMSGLRVFWLSPPLDGKGNSGNNRHHCDDKDRVKRPRRTWRHDLVREAVRGHACAFAERSVLCSFELHSTDRIAVATHPVRLRTRTVPPSVLPTVVARSRRSDGRPGFASTTTTLKSTPRSRASVTTAVSPATSSEGAETPSVEMSASTSRDRRPTEQRRATGTSRAQAQKRDL